MCKQDDNKAVVGRWFAEFSGNYGNLAVVDEIAAPDMLLKYSLHEPRRGREDIKAFMTDFRVAFPDLNFWGTADLIAEGDTVRRSVGARPAEPTPVLPSTTFLSAAFRPRAAARCASPAQRS